MGKFYLEISKECAEYLKIRGVGEAQIMVVDDASTPRRHRPLLRAIEEVTGVNVVRVFSNERTRYTVMARTIYAHYAQLDGDGNEQLQASLGKDRRMTNYYLRDYFNKVEFDREFRTADMRIRALLDKDPEWKPPKIEKPKAKKRRRKRKRLRPLKFAQPKQQPRQLELF